MSVIIGLIVDSFCFYLYGGLSFFLIYLLYNWGLHAIFSFLLGMIVFFIANGLFQKYAYSYSIFDDKIVLFVVSFRIISIPIDQVENIFITTNFSFGTQYVTRVGIGFTKLFVKMKKGNMYSLPVANIRKFDLLNHNNS